MQVTNGVDSHRSSAKAMAINSNPSTALEAFAKAINKDAGALSPNNYGGLNMMNAPQAGGKIVS